MWGADDNIEKTIKDLYASSQAMLRNIRTRQDLDRALSTFAPEWVGMAPAGWRRIRQEKFFPDRPLSEDGKPLILPQ